jgi:hypothetical protein
MLVVYLWPHGEYVGNSDSSPAQCIDLHRDKRPAELGDGLLLRTQRLFRLNVQRPATPL